MGKLPNRLVVWKWPTFMSFGVLTALQALVFAEPTAQTPQPTAPPIGAQPPAKPSDAPAEPSGAPAEPGGAVANKKTPGKTAADSKSNPATSKPNAASKKRSAGSSSSPSPKPSTPRNPTSPPTVERAHFGVGGFVGWWVLGRGLNSASPDGEKTVSSPSQGLRGNWNWRPRIRLESAVVFLPTLNKQTPGVPVGLEWRGSLRYGLIIGKNATLFSDIGLGALSSFAVGEDEAPTTLDLSFFSGGALEVRVHRSAWARLDLHYVAVPTSSIYAGTEVLVGVGVEFDPPPAKALVETAETRAQDRKKRRILDSDGDGLFDHFDRCPFAAEDKDGYDDRDGCPEDDNDGDGVSDDTDKCPLVAEEKNLIDDEDGCPDEDPDNDGLVGSQDKCPNEPEDFDTVEDTDGCIDIDVDTDRDGVFDHHDDCNDKSETLNGFADGDGCPDSLPLVIKQLNGPVRGLSYNKGESELNEPAKVYLDQAFKTLSKYTDVRITITGHASADEGDLQTVQTLSQARADAVRGYFLQRGVDLARMISVGVGSQNPRPKAKRKSKIENNRRVEISVVVGKKP